MDEMDFQKSIGAAAARAGAGPPPDRVMMHGLPVSDQNSTASRHDVL